MRILVSVATLLCSIFLFGQNVVQRNVRFILLPDIQTYTRDYPEIFYAQTNWIKEHADSITFVLQQGDLTEYSADEQWDVAVAGMGMLDNIVPYAVVMGNHDLGNNSDSRDSHRFNTYFPYSKYSNTHYFGGAFEDGKMDNVWYSFTAGRKKWLILCLEFGPRNAVLNWAGEVVRTHPSYNVIINTHAYMYSDDTRMGVGDRWLPQEYGIGKYVGENTANDGEGMWEKLVKRYPNILFVFSGHVINDGTGTLVSEGVHGNKVYQMLANYQLGVPDAMDGKSGYLRIVDVDVKRHSVSVRTYSPYLNRYKTDEDNCFSFEKVSFN